MSFRRPELSTMFPAKSQKTYEIAWFSPHFGESEEKRAKAYMKNTRTTARSQKRNKNAIRRVVFGTCSKSEQAKTMKQEAWNRGPEA